MLRWLMALAGLLLAGTTAHAQRAGAGSEPGYLLGKDDQISVVVYGQQEFNVQTRIKSDGTISLPLIGRVQASGQTVIGLADGIEAALKRGGYLKQPIVNVEVLTFVSRYARVAGKVSQPGLVPLDRPYRALDVLLKSGWVREGGASYVYLRHAADNREVRLDAEQLARGAPDKNPVVQPGDTLFVPEADIVYLYGQVNRPGPQSLRPGLTLRQALASAGGVTASGSEKGVRLFRGGKQQEIAIDEVLQRDDVLVVRERLF